MKTFILICMVILSFSVNCYNDKKQSEVINITGTWGIVDLTYITPEGTQKVMEAEIKNGSAISDFYFMNDSKFRQTSNMSGSEVLETYEGTWKITGNKLIITLLYNGQNIDVDYTIELKDGLLILTRTSPDGKISIVNTFRKK